MVTVSRSRYRRSRQFLSHSSTAVGAKLRRGGASLPFELIIERRHNCSKYAWCQPTQRCGRPPTANGATRRCRNLSLTAQCGLRTMPIRSARRGTVGRTTQRLLRHYSKDLPSSVNRAGGLSSSAGSSLVLARRCPAVGLSLAGTEPGGPSCVLTRRGSGPRGRGVG